MYAQIEKQKDNTSRASTNSVAQNNFNNTNKSELIDSRNKAAGQRILQSKMHKTHNASIAIQMNKDICPGGVVYGAGFDRENRKGQLRAIHPNTHLTVDELNRDIGLTQASLSGPMTLKRANINAALALPPAPGFTADEIAWITWLNLNINALLMHEMDGEQCRTDRKMIGKFKRFFNKHFRAPRRHVIDAGDGLFWEQEKHRVNRLHAKPQSEKNWNPIAIANHDNMVNADSWPNYVAAKALLDASIGVHDAGEIDIETQAWLNTEVKHRFWRLTSLIALDFFTNRGNPVEFARPEHQADRPLEADRTKRSITDSEWAHANKRGYIGRGVTRVDP